MSIVVGVSVSNRSGEDMSFSGGLWPQASAFDYRPKSDSTVVMSVPRATADVLRAAKVGPLLSKGGIIEQCICSTCTTTEDSRPCSLTQYFLNIGFIGMVSSQMEFR